ncbi:hypothetical protein NQ315_006396 [Exocentrus adspersus]|uniref:DUF4604 domain-containing protein n=1 Tax=Exocentrus adspersus TaxID=1586481 RepID=A0AAV8W145_9CUCU|nr:hypothetical protein NQ315_006396 [Exocentrus adspersus]
MSKRHVAYIKPNEPSFLKRLKQEAGYKEGPTVDTKRENLSGVADEDLQDTEDEQPTVVVLKSGDLTAEEAAREAERLRKVVEAASGRRGAVSQNELVPLRHVIALFRQSRTYAGPQRDRQERNFLDT